MEKAQKQVLSYTEALETTGMGTIDEWMNGHNA